MVTIKAWSYAFNNFNFFDWVMVFLMVLGVFVFCAAIGPKKEKESETESVEQLFKTIFGKLDGTDIHINQRQISYRKRDGKLEVYKTISEKEYEEILVQVQEEMELEDEIKSKSITKEVVINDINRRILYLATKTARERIAFTFRLYLS